MDVAITNDCTRALLTTSNNETVILLDLKKEPPQIIDVEPLPIICGDVALTQDNLFVVIVDGDTNEGIASNSL